MNASTPHRARRIPAFPWTVALFAALLPATLGAAETVDKAKMDLGRQVFTKIAVPQCGICHTLADAGTKGEIGAKFEEIQPDEERIRNAVRGGLGVMPKYDNTLTKEQIDAVAYYVFRAIRAK